MKITLCVLALFTISCAFAQDKTLTGVWRMKGFEGDKGDREIAIIQSKGALKMLGQPPAGKWSVIGGGKVSNNQVTLQCTNGPSYSLTYDDARTLISAGTNASTKHATVTFVSSLYMCSNHVPTNHVGTSMGDMRQLTQQFHCVGWHSVDSSQPGAEQLADRLIETSVAIQK